MIDIDDLCIKHYCHPKCEPYKNICRLAKQEAFSLAHKLAEAEPGSTSLERFSVSHFDNYYARRMEVDKILYDTFVSLGGKPKEKHPIFFVLHHSKTLEKWVDMQSFTGKLKIKDIPSEFISFTLDDSMVSFKKTKKITMYTKEELLCILSKYNGTIDEYIAQITKNHYCIEAQVWNDDYCK